MKMYQTGTAKRNKQIERNIKKLVSPSYDPIIFTNGYSLELLPSGFNVSFVNTDLGNVNRAYLNNLNGQLFFNVFAIALSNGEFADWFDLESEDFSVGNENLFSGLTTIVPSSSEMSTINTLNAILKPFFIFNNSNLHTLDSAENDVFWFGTDSGVGIEYYNNTLHFTRDYISTTNPFSIYSKATKILPFLNNTYPEFNAEDITLFNKYTVLLESPDIMYIISYTARPQYVTVRR